MLKKIAFLTRRPDLTDAQFRAYWRETHGLVVAQSPGYERYRLGYAQNHIQGSTPIGAPFPWSGMAEFWLPGDSPNEDDYATTSIYRDRIAIDERNFIDMDGTISMTAKESRILDGTGGAKLVIVAVPSTDALEPGDLAAATLDSRAELRGLATGWTVNTVLPGTFRLTGARDVDDPGIDAVHELWFRDAGARETAAALLAEAVGNRLDAARSSSFFAEEIIAPEVTTPHRRNGADHGKPPPRHHRRRGRRREREPH
jgi:uncharacterized protein (TIGR02118 family)